MIKKAGFTIFESLMYISICVLMSWFAAWWGLHFLELVKRSMRLSDDRMALFVVMKHIVRDVERAPRDLAYWKKVGNKKWYLDGRRLYRKEDGVQSVVMDGVEKFDMILHEQQGLIIAATCTLQFGTCSLSRYILVGKGRLLCNCSLC